VDGKGRAAAQALTKAIERAKTRPGRRAEDVMLRTELIVRERTARC